MAHRNRREEEDKAQENPSSFDRVADQNNTIEHTNHASTGEFERHNNQGSMLNNRYRDNDLYERQNA